MRGAKSTVKSFISLC